MLRLLGKFKPLWLSIVGGWRERRLLKAREMDEKEEQERDVISSRATASEIKAKPASVVLDLPASGLRATIAGNYY